MHNLMYGWSEDLDEWVKVQCDEDGNILVDLALVNLDDLGDVVITAPADGDVLSYDLPTGKWGNTPPAGGGPTIVRKTADQIVNNSDVFVDDDELFFPIGANEVWEFTILCIQHSSEVAGFARQLVGPSGASAFTHQVADDNLGNMVLQHTPLGTSLETYGYEEDMLELIHGIVKNGSTPGNFQFQWAQATVEVSDTIVRANSCIIAHKLA